MPQSNAAIQKGAPNALFVAARALARRFGLAALVGSLVLVTACTTRGGRIPYDVELARPDTPVSLALADDYRISPLDTLKISVFQVEDLSGDYEVDLTGHVALPLVGNVKAVDMTTAQLDEKLTALFGAKYLQSPDISIGVKSSSTQVVTVDGSVRSPGVFPVRGQMTLLQAVALAKGTDELANPRRVAVFRQVGGQRMAAAFDLTAIRRGANTDPRIYSGDIIVVDGSKLKALQRDIFATMPLLSVFSPIAM